MIGIRVRTLGDNPEKEAVFDAVCLTSSEIWTPIYLRNFSIILYENYNKT
jgi:hypothetical protein